MRNVRQLALTPELVARVHREVEDTGQEEGVSYHTDEDYEAWVRTMLTQRDPSTPMWLFAYGSLIWKPEIQHSRSKQEQRAGGTGRFVCDRPGGEAPRSSPA